ncbi:MAG: hypothetical protein JWN82_372 [Candidatus Saccharibacteria bacterium]|nr:hypothetical protein [Candidatus Saccharibacteria bacterium]
MLQKIKNYVMALMLPLAMAAPLALAPVAAHAEPIGGCNNGIQGSLNQGINSATTNNNQTCSTTSNGGVTGIQDIASKVVNFLSVIVGVVAVIMIIVGGFRYITSGGDSSNVSGAKNTLIYAIVGLIIVALAQFIVHFVLDNVT